ncbi:MAG: hypothetical protein V1775_06925 [Bacteroidota bacterium]
MKQIIFLSGLLFLILVSFESVPAQSNRPVRLEIPVKDDTEIYKVVPCAENGVMIIYLSSETDAKDRMIWITAFLDRNLKELWRKSVAIPRGFVLSDALFANDHMIGFWYSPKGSAPDNFRLFDVKVKDSAVREAVITVPVKSDIPHFGICNSYALAGLNTKDEKAVFIHYNLTTGVLTNLDQLVEGNVVIESMNIDNESGTVSMVMRTIGSARKRAYFLVKADRNGRKISELALTKFDDNNMVNTAFAYKVDNTTDLVIGSFGKSSRTRIIDGNESIGVSSTGFFSILIQDNREINTTFYEFSALQNFYRYLRKPSDLSVRKATNRVERGGKEISIDHDLLAHDVFKWKDNYVFIAEAYYPEYRTVTTMVYDYYGRPYPSTYSVFEGFRYLTTFIAGFDSTGIMKWNNDLELRNMVSQNLKQRVISWEDPDGLVLSYTDDARIASKMLNEGGNTSTNILFTDIAPLSARDKIFKDSNSSILAWYGDFFLVYGYQNIRNNYQNDRNNKNVFYLNKLAFR